MLGYNRTQEIERRLNSKIEEYATQAHRNNLMDAMRIRQEINTITVELKEQSRGISLFGSLF